MSAVLEYIQIIFQIFEIDNAKIRDLVVLFIVFSGLEYFIQAFLKKHEYPKSYKIGSLIIVVNLFLGSSSWLVFSNIWVVMCFVAIIVGTIIVFVIHHVILKFELNRLQDLINTDRLASEQITTLKKLNNISPKALPPKLSQQLLLLQISFSIKLGNISKGETLLAKLKEDNPYVRHVRFMICYTIGDMDKAAVEMQLAENHSSSDSECFLSVQMLANRGVSYVAKMEYQNADIYFENALENYKECKRKSRELRHILYFNYISNLARIGDSSWEGRLERYEEDLDLNDFIDQSQLLNLKLELYKQLEFNRAIINKTVQQSLKTLIDIPYPSNKKMIYIIALARAIWAARIEPDMYLEEVSRIFHSPSELPMPERYFLMRDLELFFLDLHGYSKDKYERLRILASDYLNQHALSDLENLLKDLPSDMVFLKAGIFKELSELQSRRGQEYHAEKVKEYLQSAIVLYSENKLKIQESQSRLNIADTLCRTENLNEDLKLSDPNEMRTHLELVEDFLPQLIKHPMLAEYYLRLSYYYMRLDDYKKSAEYYVKFQFLEVSLEHFAPWWHRFYLATTIVFVAYQVLQTIEKIKISKDIITFHENIQSWFFSFPNHNGYFESLVLQEFIGVQEHFLMKVKGWSTLDRENKITDNIHHWIYDADLRMNIDITYSQFEDDMYSECIVFDQDKHPLQTSSSYVIKSRESLFNPNSEPTNTILVNSQSLRQFDKEFTRKLTTIIAPRIETGIPSKEDILGMYVNCFAPICTDNL